MDKTLRHSSFIPFFCRFWEPNWRGQTWDSGFKAHVGSIAATFLASSWFDSARHFCAKSVEMFKKEWYTSVIAYNLVAQFRRQAAVDGTRRACEKIGLSVVGH